MKRTGRIRGALFGALLAIAGAAWAEDETIRGTALVIEKDVAQGTIVLDGRSFQVRESTELVGAAGERITLLEIGVARREHGGLVATKDSVVAYEAMERGSTLLLSSLHVLPGLPN